MRDFHMFNPAIWKDQNFRVGLTDREKLAYLFIATNHHQTMLGSYYMPDNYAASDLGWSLGEYRAIRKKLQDVGLMIYDDASEEVFVVDWFRVNPPKNYKHYLGIVNCLRKTQSDLIHDTSVSRLHDTLQQSGPPDWFCELEDKGLVAELRDAKL